MIRYYAAGGLDEPEPVECPNEGYPNRDAKGRVQYDNSHYTELVEAWEHLLRDVEAQVSIVGRDVEQARTALRRREQEAGEAAARFARIRDGHLRWLQINPEAGP